MSGLDILSLIITIICLVSFCAVFTILFRSYFKNAEEGVIQGKEDLFLLQDLALEEEEKHSKKKRAKVIIQKTLSYSLLALVILFFGFSLGAKISGSPLVFGEVGTLVISSGSMSKKNTANSYLWSQNLDNQLQTYDIIGVSRVHSPEEIKLYDIIAFQANDGRTIVHRVVEILETDGHTFYVTRGDANSSSDNGDLYGDYLPYEAILGEYNGVRIPVLGVFVIFLQSGAGIATIFSLIYCYFMYGYYRKRLDKAMEERVSYLVDTLNFDPLDTNNPAYCEEKEEIVYKGEIYLFSEGKFISSRKASEEEITYFVSSAESHAELDENQEKEGIFAKIKKFLRKEDDHEETK